MKLDLFHGVKRLTQFMPKGHPFHAEAVKTVGLIFREATDIFEDRKLPTPSAEIILKNLNNLRNGNLLNIMNGKSYLGKQCIDLKRYLSIFIKAVY